MLEKPGFGFWSFAMASYQFQFSLSRSESILYNKKVAFICYTSTSLILTMFYIVSHYAVI